MIKNLILWPFASISFWPQELTETVNPHKSNILTNFFLLYQNVQTQIIHDGRKIDLLSHHE